MHPHQHPSHHQQGPPAAHYYQQHQGQHAPYYNYSAPPPHHQKAHSYHAPSAPYGYPSHQHYYPPHQHHPPVAPYHQQQHFSPSPSASAPSEWRPSSAELATLSSWFASVASNNTISGTAAVSLLQASGLPREVLRHIWGLVDSLNRGFIEQHQFIVTMRLVALAQHPKYSSMPLSMQLYHDTANESLSLARLAEYNAPPPAASHSASLPTTTSNTPVAAEEDEWSDFAAPAAAPAVAAPSDPPVPLPSAVSLSNLSDLTEATPIVDNSNNTNNIAEIEEEDFGDFAAPQTTNISSTATPEKRKVDISSLLASITQDPLNMHSSTLSQELQHMQSMKSSDSNDVVRRSTSNESSVAIRPATAADRLAALDELAEMDLMAEKEEWDDFTDFTKPTPSAAPSASINPFDAYVASEEHVSVEPQRIPRKESDDFGDFSTAMAADTTYNLPEEFAPVASTCGQPPTFDPRTNTSAHEFPRPRVEPDDFGEFTDADCTSNSKRPHLSSDDFGDFATCAAAAAAAAENSRDDVPATSSEVRPHLSSDDFGDFSSGIPLTASEPNSSEGPTLPHDSSQRPRVDTDDFGDFTDAPVGADSIKDPWDDISLPHDTNAAPMIEDVISFGDYNDRDATPEMPSIDEPIVVSASTPDEAVDEFGDFEQSSATSQITDSTAHNFATLPPLPPTATVPPASKTVSIHSATSMSNLSITSNTSNVSLSSTDDPFAELTAQTDVPIPPTINNDDFGDFSVPTAAPPVVRKPSAAVYLSSKPSDSKVLLQQVQQQCGIAATSDDEESQISVHLPSPSEQRNLSCDELESVVSVLLSLNQLPQAYRCLKQAAAARKIKELNIKKMAAVENDDLELAIQYRDEIAKLKDGLAGRDEEMRWLNLAREGAPSESIADIVEILTAIDESAGDFARVKYIDSQLSPSNMSEEHLVNLIDIRRRLQLAIALRTSHVEYVSKWQQILTTVKSCLQSASHHISSFASLSKADQTALTNEGKMNIFIRGLARIMEVGMWVSASCVEAQVLDELWAEVQALVKDVHHQASDALHMSHEYSLPSIDDLSRQAAELVGCSNVTYCNLTLRPVAVTVMKVDG